MRPLFSLLAGSVAVVLLAAPARAQRPPWTPGDTVRAAVLEDWPPHYRFQDDGAPTGFAVDVMEEVAARVGLDVDYVRFQTFPAAIAALENGDVDVIPDFGIIPSRTDAYAFTRPFDAFRISVFVRESSSDRESTSALAGRRVAVVRSNAAVELLRERHPEADLVLFDNVREALFELMAAGVDAAAYPEEVFLALARSVDMQERIRLLADPLTEVPRGMGVRTTDTVLRARLDEGVEELVGSPAYQEIYQRWFRPPEPILTVEGLLWGGGGLLLFVLLGMGLWRYRSVSKLAARLEESLDERGVAEAALRESEERFRQIAEHIDNVFWITTPGKDVMEYVSPAYADLWGHRPEELYEDARGWLDHIHPDDRQRVLDALPRQEEGTYEEEYRIVGADGEVRWIWDRAFPIRNEQGEVYRIVGVAEDITERVEAERRLRERERRFRAFVENATDLISTLDREGHMMYQSPPIERLLGYEPDELRGRSVFELIHPEEREEALLAWEELIEEPGATLQLAPFRFRHKDGTWRIWEAMLTNLLDEPAVGAILANSRDVTDREELERQLRQSQKLEAVGRLAGGVAHDFNNLLTVIRANTEFLVEGYGPSDPEGEHAEEIRQAAIRGADLTRQLLAFSRDQVLEPRATQLNDVVAAMERLLQRVIGEDVELATELEDELPAVEIDPGQLEQVIMNLAVNGRDAMPDGGELEITTRSIDLGGADRKRLDLSSEGLQVALTFRDTGRGMDEETRERIFEPFFTTKPQESGTGLGLATVHGVVRQSGGAIEVESEPGTGTTFHLYFPATDKEVVEELEAEPSVRSGSVGGGEHVLAVEDDGSVRRALRHTLLKYGYEVTDVGNVAEAKHVLADSSAPFDLILTDLVLPDASGFDLVEHVRGSYPDVKLIVMSGYSRHEVLEERVLQQDIRFLAKPFTPEDVGEIVGDVLKTHSD